MDEEGVIGPGFGLADRGPKAAAFAVVGGFDFGADEVSGVDVKCPAAEVGFRAGAGGDRYFLLGWDRDAVRNSVVRAFAVVKQWHRPCG